jgi:hypothetical protein
MSYPFDPELAAAVAMMPAVEITDIPAARAQMGEMFAAALGEPDRSGVQVRDELVPGPDGPPTCGCGSTPPTGRWRPRRSTTSTAAASCSARSTCSTRTTCAALASSASPS